MDNKTKDIYINIPVYKSGEINPYRYEKCDALLKNIYDLPFLIEAADDSMAPLINMPYITFLNDKNNAMHIRYCLKKMM